MTILGKSAPVDKNSKDFAIVDSFGAVKTAEANSQISLIFTRSLDTARDVTTTTAGSCTISSQYNRSMGRIAASAVGSGSIQTKNTLRYRPGADLEINFTAQFEGTTSTGDYMYIGGYTTCTGAYLGYKEGNFIVGYRNIYADDGGTPASGGSEPDVTQTVDMSAYDLTKLHRFRIRLGYLGAGDIIFEIKEANKVWTVLHRFGTDGTLDARTHIGCPLLPMRCEVNSATGNALTLYTASWNGSALTKELTLENKPFFHRGSRSVTPTTTPGPVVAFRNKTTFDNYPNLIKSQALGFEFGTGSEGLYFIEFYKFAAGGITTGSWSDVNSYSVIEVNSTFTEAASGGVYVASKLIAVPSSGAGVANAELNLEKMGMVLYPGEEMGIYITEIIAGAGTNTTAWSISYFDLT